MAEHNHDINVSQEFANRFPQIKHLLVLPDVFKVFDGYDRIAKRYKFLYQALGIASLVIGLFSMLGVVAELLFESLKWELPTKVAMAIELSALLAILIIAFDCLVLRTRSNYLSACFAREQIRLWRFQLFIDGRFVENVAKDRVNAREECQTRWQTFKEALKLLKGAQEDFVRRRTVPIDLNHHDTPYTDPVIAKQVFDALLVLRFNYQAQYARSLTAAETPGRIVALRSQFDWSETLARLGLLGALILPAIQLFVIKIEAHTLHASLSAAALALVALSATARAYRTGLTLPEEIESYEEYTAHIDTLRELFLMSGTSDERKREILKELETEAARELRRFLAMKSKSTFVV